MCSICKKYKPIYTNIGNEFCFLCATNIYRSSLSNNQPERSKREEYTRGHTDECEEYRNICYHTAEFKQICPYKEHCEFVNPVFISIISIITVFFMSNPSTI
jgi:hypothetical protein